MKELKGMLKFVFRHVEFPGKGRASKRTFLMGIWKFGSPRYEFGSHLLPSKHEEDEDVR